MAFLSCSSLERWTAIGIKKGSSMDWPQRLSGHKGLRCNMVQRTSRFRAGGAFEVFPDECTSHFWGVFCVDARQSLGKVRWLSLTVLPVDPSRLRDLRRPRGGPPGARFEDRRLQDALQKSKHFACFLWDRASTSL